MCGHWFGRGRLVGMCVLLAALPACGISPTGGIAPSPSPTAAQETLVVIEDEWRPSPADDPYLVRTLRLVNLHGTEVASVNPSIRLLGATASRVFYLDSRPQADASGKLEPGVALKALDRNGHVETLKSFGALQLASAVLSPDGTQLLWSEVTSRPPASVTTHSRLHLTTFGGSDRVFADYEAPTSWKFNFIGAYEWDAGGAIVAALAGSAPTTLLMANVWDAYLLDPQSWELSPLWPGSTCTLPARAADGTVACILLNSGDADGTFVLNIGVPPNVSVSTRIRADPGLGSISFKAGPSASLIAIGLHRTWQLPSGGVTTYFGPTTLIDVKTGVDRPFGPAGMTPPNGSWAWLDDGSLIEYNISPPQADPETTTTRGVTYVVSPDGNARQLAVGFPRGVLRLPPGFPLGALRD